MQYATFDRFEIALSLEDAHCGYHSGQCNADIEDLMRVPYIKEELAKLDPDKVRAELKEYGAWEPEQLLDDDDNLSLILWLACGNVVENYNGE